MGVPLLTMTEEYARQLESVKPKSIIRLSLALSFVSFILALFAAVARKGVKGLSFDISLTGILIFILGYLLLLAVHEALHAASFLIVGKVKKKEISFGANLRNGLLYCHLKTPLKPKAYAICLLVPVLLTGIIPLIVFTLIGHINYILLFSLLVSGGAGDLLMFYKVRRVPKDALISDHPYAPAFYVVYEKGREPAGFRYVTAEQEERLAREYGKKRR